MDPNGVELLLEALVGFNGIRNVRLWVEIEFGFF
jgi:hypothetical protein